MLYMYLKTGVWYFTLLLYPLGIIWSMMIFLGKMDRKQNFGLRCLVSIASIFALMLFLPTFPEIIAYHIIYFLIINIFVVFALWFAFDVSFFNLLACYSAGICIKYLLTAVSDLFFINTEGTGPLWVQLVRSFFNFAICLVLYFVIHKNYIRRSISYVNDFEVSLILVGSVLLVIVFDQLSRLLDGSVAQRVVIDLYSIFGSLLILVIEFFMLNRNKAVEDYKKATFMLEMNEKRYELNENIAEMANIRWHDFKHLAELFGERTDSESVNDFIESTGSCALDAVLIANVISCRKKNIKFTWFCEKNVLNGFDEIDIYSVFCNLMDNAKEATEQISDETKRVISLVCSGDMIDFVRIRITNYYSGTIESEDGLPATTKQKSELHGFGLKSVKIIAEKYNGKMQISADGETFELQLLLCKPSC